MWRAGGGGSNATFATGFLHLAKCVAVRDLDRVGTGRFQVTSYFVPVGVDLKLGQRTLLWTYYVRTLTISLFR